MKRKTLTLTAVLIAGVLAGSWITAKAGRSAGWSKLFDPDYYRDSNPGIIVARIMP
jgi:hypothetical protein